MVKNILCKPVARQVMNWPYGSEIEIGTFYVESEKRFFSIEKDEFKAFKDRYKEMYLVFYQAINGLIMGKYILQKNPMICMEAYRVDRRIILIEHNEKEYRFIPEEQESFIFGEPDIPVITEHVIASAGINDFDLIRFELSCDMLPVDRNYTRCDYYVNRVLGIKEIHIPYNEIIYFKRMNDAVVFTNEDFEKIKSKSGLLFKDLDA